MKITSQLFTKSRSKEAHEEPASTNDEDDALNEEPGATFSNENLNHGNTSIDDHEHGRTKKNHSGFFSKMRIKKKKSDEVRSTSEESAQTQEPMPKETTAASIEPPTDSTLPKSSNDMELCGYEIGCNPHSNESSKTDESTTTNVPAEESATTPTSGISRFYCGSLCW